mmetsp:Transcript_16098/g.26997  ORF Transcript_16098/g.26997 Transcript_16098/m.26997 type:complete len:248 (-) Transcript_16098:931-1674(-)
MTSLPPLVAPEHGLGTSNHPTEPPGQLPVHLAHWRLLGAAAGSASCLWCQSPPSDTFVCHARAVCTSPCAPPPLQQRKPLHHPMLGSYYYHYYHYYCLFAVAVGGGGDVVALRQRDIGVAGDPAAAQCFYAPSPVHAVLSGARPAVPVLPSRPPLDAHCHPPPPSLPPRSPRRPRPLLQREAQHRSCILAPATSAVAPTAGLAATWRAIYRCEQMPHRPCCCRRRNNCHSPPSYQDQWRHQHQQRER